MEEWRVIPNTNKLFLASNEGRIMSLLRTQPHILKPTIDKKGYERVQITNHGKIVCKTVHRAVALAFIDNPNNYSQVNHIDGNKRNNNVSNLEWCSNEQNRKHAIENNLWLNGNIDGLLKSNKNRQKAIIAIKGNETIQFESISEAERYFNSRHIVDVLKKRREHVKGWSFVYESEVM